MYSKKRTLSNGFTLTQKKIDLPRDAIIDAIHTKFTIVLTNSNAAERTTTYAAVLANLQEMRLVSDGSNVHYALNALDLAVINYYDFQGVSVNPDTVITVPLSGTKTITFVLTMNQGDIVAVMKDSLEYSIEVVTAVTADISITSFAGLVTLEENILTPAELGAMYGPNMEYLAEPKVTTQEKSFAVSEELTEFFDLPTGTLQRRAFLMFKDASGVIGGVSPSKVGLIATTPDRREIFTADLPTLTALNGLNYRISDLVTGIVAIDYATEITNDALGFRGWKWNKGDYQFALKSAAAGKMRYISCEFVVQTKVVDAASARLALEAIQ